MKIHVRALAGIFGALLASSAANAAITVFSGTDNGAPTTGPFPNSAAAQSSFLTTAGTFGSVNTATFEGLAVGFYSPIAAGPGLSIGLTGTNFGNGFSGVSNTTLGNLFGFNTTSGGSQFLGTSGDVTTFNFSGGTHSLGMYLTGLQTTFTAALTITFNDGTSESLSVPISSAGGAEYFGFTDSQSFTSAVLTDTSTTTGTDAWGIDDVSYNAPSTSVPEPLTFSLFGAGLVGAIAMRRRKVKA